MRIYNAPAGGFSSSDPKRKLLIVIVVGLLTRAFCCSSRADRIAEDFLAQRNFNEIKQRVRLETLPSEFAVGEDLFARYPNQLGLRADESRPILLFTTLRGDPSEDYLTA